jgi:hypothetical protein
MIFKEDINMKKWKDTDKRYVCFVDIMGFKNFVYRNSHEAVKRRMTKFQKIISENERTIQAVSKALGDTMIFPNKNGHMIKQP